jgi:ubiquinone/menaquinone biosynthesis C-methylase UbiE
MAAVMNSEESARRWDNGAAEFASVIDEQGDIHRRLLLNPVLFEFLGDLTGKQVLDAGCGEGYLSRLMAANGASVVGVDYSRGMLKLAAERTDRDAGSTDVEYRHGNAERLDFLDDATFDIVVSNMVLVDLEDYQSAINEAYRVLVPGGLFVLANVNPAFSAPGGGWHIDHDGRRLHWKVDDYFSEVPSEMPILAHSDTRFIQFHRTLTSLVRAILGAGFIVEDLVEPSPSEEAITEHPEFSRNHLRMSHFIVFKLRK